MDKLIILERINNMLVSLEAIGEETLVSVKKMHAIDAECKALSIEAKDTLLQETQASFENNLIKLDEFVSKLLVFRDQFKKENKLELDEITGKYYVI